MADGTKIEWTEATWNPITGCSVVSPGCTNCYAMQLAGTRLAHHPSRAGLTRDTKAGPVWTGEVRFNEEWLDQPIRWRRPRMVFVCAHGDLFHDDVPDEWIDRVFAVMALARQHTFQVLTKRAERMRDYLQNMEDCYHGNLDLFRQRWCDVVTDLPWPEDADRIVESRPFPLPNVWLGVSVEDQARADERIPVLLDTPAAVRWISAEPLLGPVELGPTWIDRRFAELGATVDPTLDWVVVGGESGRGARQMDIAWARRLVSLCQAFGVAVFVKQLGSNPVNGPYREWIDAPKGGDPGEWPRDLRVRERPQT
jgi:protein gp37